MVAALACTTLALPAHAQSTRAAADTLGRDVATGAIATPVDKGLPTVVMNNDTPAAPANDGTMVMVGAIAVRGAPEIPASAFAPAIEQFVGKTANSAELQNMARALADVARQRGYIFASAIVPPQNVERGTVTVQLDPGRIDFVRVEGSENRKLRRILEKIAGPAVRRETLERQLLLAGDIPGIIVLGTRFVRDSKGPGLVVQVRESRIEGQIAADNYGPRELGPARLRLRVDFAELLADDDVLTIQAVGTPLEPKELAYVSVRYSKGIGDSGAEIGIAGALGHTKPGDGLGIITGESRYAAVFASASLLRRQKLSIWANAELAYLHVDQSVLDIKAQRDELVTYFFSLAMSGRVAGGRLNSGLGIVNGLGIAGTTQVGEPFASRFDASGRFTKGIFWASWNRDFGHGVSLRLAANGQLADRPLLASQEIAIGGPGFGRGYDFNERFGDNGILGLAELRKQFNKPLHGVDWVQIYGFADGGYVDNLGNDYGDGSLFSAGSGLRALMGKTEIGVEAALPLSGPRLETGTRKPRLNLSVTQSF